MSATDDAMPERLLAHTGWVRALARNLVEDQALVDDVVQQTLLTALEQPSRRALDLKKWLGGVARNVARQFARADSRRRRREQHASVTELEADTHEIAARVELQRLLAGKVLALEEPYRSTILLRFFEGLASHEIARRTRTPAATVRVRLKRGLDSLRQEMCRQTDTDARGLALALVPVATSPRRLVLPSLVLISRALIVSTTFKIAAVTTAIAALVVAVTLTPNANRSDTAVVTEPVADPVEHPAVTDTRGDQPSRVRVGATAFRTDLPNASLEPDASTIVGRVTANANPVGAARVIAIDATPRSSEILAPGDPAETETTTDAGGCYRLRVDRGRPWLIRVEHASFAPGFARNCYAGERHDVALQPGSRMRVRVVRGDTREPVANARVEVGSVTRSGRPVAWSLATTTTADGRGVLERVPAGEARVWARAAGLAQRGAIVSPDGRSTIDVELELPPGAAVTGVVLAAEDDRPLVDATVECHKRAVRTDGEGRFRLDGIHASEQTSHPIIAIAAGRAPDVIYATLPEPGQTRELTFRLTAAARIAGRIVDDASTPIDAARVFFEGVIKTMPYTAERHRGDVIADSEGRFAIHARPGARYRLLLRAPSFGETVFDVQVPDDVEVFYIGDLAMSAPASISGSIPDATRHDKIGLLRVDGGAHLPVAQQLADRRGEFRFTGLGAGRYRLERYAATGGGSHADTPCAYIERDLAAGEHCRGIELLAREKIRGTVTDPDGAPLRGIRVRLFDGDRSVALTVTETDGRFALLPSDGGELRVVADDLSLIWGSAEQPVLPGSRPLTLKLEPHVTAFSIAGTVLDEAGRAVPGLYVSVVRVKTGERLARVGIPGEGGGFEVENLGDEPYRLGIVDFDDEWIAKEEVVTRPNAEPVALTVRRK